MCFKEKNIISIKINTDIETEILNDFIVENFSNWKEIIEFNKTHVINEIIDEIILIGKQSELKINKINHITKFQFQNNN